MLTNFSAMLIGVCRFSPRTSTASAQLLLSIQACWWRAGRTRPAAKLLDRQDARPSTSDSCHRMPILGGIAPGCMMLQLPLDVTQQAAGAEAEHFRPQPRRPQLLFDHRQPLDGLLPRANAARRLETDRHSGLRPIFADAPSHPPHDL